MLYIFARMFVTSSFDLSINIRSNVEEQCACADIRARACAMPKISVCCVCVKSSPGLMAMSAW